MMTQLLLPAAVLAGMASAAAAPGGMFEDCSKSKAPHSNHCLMDWWHNAGCTSRYALSEEAGWVNAEDIYDIKKQMQEVYKKAAAANADPADVEKCQPVPKWQKQAQDCYVAIENDCKDCFVGPMSIFVNTTCTVQCIDNSDSLQKKCVNLYNSIQCDRKVDELCGDCVTTGFLGIPMVDPQCFTDCYNQNNQTIREACPLPEPLQKAKDCHDKLADVCSDCVSGEHDIDGECLASCWNDNEATLNKTCPVKFGELANFLATVDQSDILNSLANNLANGGGDITEISNLFGANNGQAMGQGMGMGISNGDLQGVLSQITGLFEQVFGQLFNGAPPAGTAPVGNPQEPVTFTIAMGDNTQGPQPSDIEGLLSQLGFAPPPQNGQPAGTETPQSTGSIQDLLSEFGFAPPQEPQETATLSSKPQGHGKPNHHNTEMPTSTMMDMPTETAADEDMSNMMGPTGDAASESADQRSPEQLENGLQLLLGGHQQGSQQ